MPVDELLRARVAELGEGGQRLLAEAVGVSQATASRWVNGRLVPEEKWARPLARWLGADEMTVLASISLSRRQRQDAQTQTLREHVESDEIRELRQTVGDLTRKLRALEERLAAAETRRGDPGTSSGGGQNKR